MCCGDWWHRGCVHLSYHLTITQDQPAFEASGASCGLHLFHVDRIPTAEPASCGARFATTGASCKPENLHVRVLSTAAHAHRAASVAFMPIRSLFLLHPALAAY